MRRACIKTLANLLKYANLKRHLKDRKAWQACKVHRMH